MIAATWFDAWLRALSLQDHNTRVVILATTLLGFAAGAVGSFTLLRRRALMGDALSHAMLPGIGLAFLVASALGMQGKALPWLLGGAVISGVVGTLCLLVIRHQTRLHEDAALGIVLSVFFGAGLAILGIVQQAPGGHAAGLESFIYGKTASITTQDALWIAITGGITLVLMIGFAKELTLLCFDDGFATASGFSVVLLDLLLMAAVIMITVVGLQAVGLILMIALLVTPAAAARFWVNRIAAMRWLASILGALSCLLGAFLSAAIEDLPSGATIVLTAAVFFFASLLFGPQGGLVVRLLNFRAARLQTDRQYVLCGIHELSLAPAVESASPAVSLADLATRRPWSMPVLLRELKRCQAERLIEIQQDAIRLTPAGRAAIQRLVVDDFKTFEPRWDGHSASGETQ